LPSGPKPPSRPSGGSPTGPALGATPPQGAPVETDAPPDAPSSNPFSVAFDALGGVGALGWGVVLLLALLAALAAAALVRLPRGPSKSV
jgi:hypothetical protein